MAPLRGAGRDHGQTSAADTFHVFQRVVSPSPAGGKAAVAISPSRSRFHGDITVIARRDCGNEIEYTTVPRDAVAEENIGACWDRAPSPLFGFGRLDEGAEEPVLDPEVLDLLLPLFPRDKLGFLGFLLFRSDSRQVGVDLLT